MLRFEDLRVRDRQALDADFFNRRFRLITETIGQIEAQAADAAAATERLVALGLTRVNEVLGPALAQVQAAADGGFLVATSASILTLAVGLQTTLVIDDTPARAVFSPTPFVVIAPASGGEAEDWAIIRVDGYSRSSGGLAFTCAAVSGSLSGAARGGWVISATAGVSAGVMQAAVNIANTLGIAAQAAADAQEAATLAAQAIADGPVSAVNGKTGVVWLGMSDIAGLIAAIGSKADGNHNHTIAQVANLQPTLDVLQALAASPDGGVY